MARLIEIRGETFPANSALSVSKIETVYSGAYTFVHTFEVNLKGGRVVRWIGRQCNTTVPSWCDKMKQEALEAKDKVIDTLWPDNNILKFNYSEEE